MTTDIHHAFLIHWQAVVENAYTGEKQHFADKEALKRFLSQKKMLSGLNDKCDRKEDA